MQFRFRDLVVGQAYEIEVPEIRGAGDCTKVLWKTANRGIITAGLDRRLRIEGFARRSEIEIRAIRDGRETDQWVGADALDLSDLDQSVRRFRWRANVRGTSGGRLQVSTRPFPVPGQGFDPCATPPLLYSRDFAFDRDDWVEVPDVDFARIAEGGRRPGADPAVIADPGEKFFPPTPLERRKLDLGAPLYVRVVPLSLRNRRICAVDRAGVTPIVIIAKIPFKKAPKPEKEPSLELAGARYDPPVVESWPSAKQMCYRLTKNHYLHRCEADPSYAYLHPGSCNGPFGAPYNAYGYFLHVFGGAQFFTTVPAGTAFCTSTSGGGGGGWFGDFISSVGDVISGAIDSVAELVNYASYLWEKLQDLAVDAVADALSATGFPCNATCRAGLEMGLEAGLAAMGVPPSLPNFDQLVDQGIDYVAAQVAEQTGVPPEIADLATGEAKKFVQKAAESMKSSPNNGVAGLPDWLAYDIGLKPAVLTLRVFGNGPPLPVTPFLFLNSSDVFGGASIPLPKDMPPSTSPLTIPVVLPISSEGLPAATGDDYSKARKNKNAWVQQKLTDGCAEIAMAAVAYQDWRAFMHAAVQAEVPFSYLTETGPFYCQP